MQTLQFIGKTQRPTDTNRQKDKKTKRQKDKKTKRQKDRETERHKVQKHKQSSLLEGHTDRKVFLINLYLY
jgi:hypothetical protein